LNGTTLSIFALAFELSPLLFQSTHSTQIGSGGLGFCFYQAAAAPTFPYHAFLRTHFSGFGRPVKKNWDTSPKNQQRGSPHLHSHSIEEQLLNPHYNQSKFSPDRYMMLNRDRDRERGLPLCWLFETKALIGMVLIPMFLLVSFGFESLPLPRPLLVF
jgi:hypothetical protein